MLEDRTQGEELLITQEFLAEMLGSRRTTVTLAAGALQRIGLIEYQRGRVRILDRQRRSAKGMRSALPPTLGTAPQMSDTVSGAHWVPISSLSIALRVLSDGFLRFGFLTVTVYGQTFTAVTRVRIPSGTPTKTKRLAKLRPVTVAHIRKICSNHDVWSSIFGPTTSAVQLQGSTKFVLEMDQIAPVSKGN
jgi:hypothetical protein